MASRTRNFFLNALSLTLTALVMRGVSVIFNVYISNAAGSEAMGLFALVGSVNGFAITLAAAGINLGVTRLVSDALGLGDIPLARRSARRALTCCTVSGSAASVILFSLAGVISRYILGDARATVPLRILAFSLLPVAICSCLAGYFTAVRRVKLNAASQVLIQLIKIGATVLFLSRFVYLGAEQACIALVLGSVAAEIISLVITVALYLYDIKKNLPPSNTSGGRSKSSTVLSGKGEGLTQKLLSITLPVTFSATVRSALSMIQHVLVPRGLAANGHSWSRALSSYGALHGMAMPLLLFPSAFISSFAGLLIPEVSECCIQNDPSRLERVSYRALTMSLFFSIGVSGIMIFFSHELGMTVYNNSETSVYIRILAPLIPVMYIDSAVDAILKGSGHQVYSMNVNIVDVLTACILALTLIPRMGIWGYVISIYATEILNTTLSIAKMLSVTHMRPRIFHQVIMPILCIVGATNASRLVFILTDRFFSGWVELVFMISLSTLIYIGLLLVTKTLGRDEFEFINASLLSEKRYNKKFSVADDHLSA